MSYPKCKVYNGDNARTEWINERGELHRIYEPACEWTDGAQFYYLDGKIHNLKGPAIIESLGYNSYWICDQPLDEITGNKLIKLNELLI